MGSRLTEIVVDCHDPAAQVGGRNRVAMAALREVVEGLGHTEVATYIQSGNVVFTSEEAAQLTKAGSAGTAATARNWATVRKLLDMCGS